jgi:hypothetical protein
MVDEDARDRAIYQALKAVDEVAAALQTHLIEENQADPERSSTQSTSTNSLKLLRQARERLGEGLRTIEADTIAQSDEISLRRERPQRGDQAAVACVSFRHRILHELIPSCAQPWRSGVIDPLLSAAVGSTLVGASWRCDHSRVFPPADGIPATR